jgi:hypothetical protein
MRSRASDPWFVAIVGLAVAAGAARSEEPKRELPTQDGARVKLVAIHDETFTVRDEEGSLYRIPVAGVAHYEAMHGGAEVRLVNGVTLYLATRSAPPPRPREVASSVSEPPPPPTRSPGEYAQLAGEAQRLLDAAEAAMETHRDASDLRIVAYRLRDLQQAIAAEDWGGADWHSDQMWTSLQRVRKIAEEAPNRLSKRQQRVAHRDAQISAVRSELNSLPVTRSTRCGELQRRQALLRRLSDLENERKRETEYYKSLQREACL